MKRLLKYIEKVMVAITFAEYGEHKTTEEILSPASSKDRA